jgi:hypothetical protein
VAFLVVGVELCRLPRLIHSPRYCRSACPFLDHDRLDTGVGRYRVLFPDEPDHGNGARENAYKLPLCILEAAAQPAQKTLVGHLHSSDSGTRKMPTEGMTWQNSADGKLLRLRVLSRCDAQTRIWVDYRAVSRSALQEIGAHLRTVPRWFRHALVVEMAHLLHAVASTRCEVLSNAALDLRIPSLITPPAILLKTNPESGDCGA